MTQMQPSRNLRLYGTEEPPLAERSLKAGPLTVLFDGTSLRDIRMNGEEMIRAIAFVVRDKDWATLAPSVSDLRVEEAADHFRIRYHAVASGPVERLAYDVDIRGDATGTLSFRGHGGTPTGLLTNRTGFVVLHPIEGISGAPARIVHCDGEVVETKFPAAIDPVQPMMNLREIRHRTPLGQQVTCVMEGDAFEMEDQRNWTDASYKTYVRPLALPWPYRIEAGEIVDQTVTLRIAGEPRTPARLAEGGLTVSIGEVIGHVPGLGLGLQPEDADAVLASAERLRDLGVSHVICHHDPRRGYGRETLARQVEACRSIGATPWLEAVVESVEDAGAAAEISRLGTIAAALGDPFDVVMVSPAPDLKCTLPGSVWPAAPDAGKLYDATRRAFPHARIGGGMFSFFTELNRKRPPLAGLDLVSFTTAAIFHAGDDRSMMETLECLPHIVRTIPDIAGRSPYAVGPSAIGLRDNPYGEAPVANPTNIRQAVNFNDPRQRGIMGAAWNLGYFAAFAAGGAEAVALGAATGPFGAISVPMSYPQPGFEGKGELYPVWHVLRGMARLKGAAIRSISVSDASALRGIAVDAGGGKTELWICNPRPQPCVVELPAGFGSIAVLDADRFTDATRRSDLLDALDPAASRSVTLDSYAVLRAVRA